MNKTILLERLQQERDSFELLLNQLGYAKRLTLRGVTGNFNVKDLLANVLSHEQFIADRLSEIQHGQSYTPAESFQAAEKFYSEYGYPDYESAEIEKNILHPTLLNAYKHIDFDEIVSEELAVYANILDLIQNLEHPQLLQQDLYHRIAEHTFHLYRRTRVIIQHWLRKNTPEQN